MLVQAVPLDVGLQGKRGIAFNRNLVIVNSIQTDGQPGTSDAVAVLLLVVFTVPAGSLSNLY